MSTCDGIRGTTVKPLVNGACKRSTRNLTSQLSDGESTKVNGGKSGREGVAGVNPDREQARPSMRVRPFASLWSRVKWRLVLPQDTVTEPTRSLKRYKLLRLSVDDCDPGDIVYWSEPRLVLTLPTKDIPSHGKR